MSRVYQQFGARVVLVLVVVLVLGTSLSLSNSIHLRITPQPDRHIVLEWNSETGATYAVYWREGFSDRWHLLSEQEGAPPTNLLADIGAPSDDSLMERQYMVRKVVPTYVTADITSNTTWRLLESPYILTNTVVIRDGAVLTLEAGVSVQGGALVVSNGALRAMGTSDENITLTSCSVSFQDNSRDSMCALSNVNILAAGVGITCSNSSPLIVDCSIRYCGPGILLHASAARIRNCAVCWNYYGPGISCASSTCLVEGCTIEGNWPGISCGGDSVLVLRDCSITRNTSFSGGGLLVDSSRLQMENCSVAYNTASRGAGMYFRAATACISNCVVAGNMRLYETGYGGGLYCDASSPTLVCTRIEGNWVGGGFSQGFGAGLYCINNSDVMLSACTLAGNSSRDKGGAIYCSPGCDPTLVNCVISGNSASQGGVIYSSWAAPALINCTVIGNGGGGSVLCGDGEWGASARNTIMWANAAPSMQGTVGEVDYCCVQDMWSWSHNITNDPRFIADTFEPNTASPCIDAGSASNAPGVDLKGATRAAACGTTNAPSPVDIGAYEYADSDCDGMADAWERLHFGDLSHGAHDHGDADGLADLEECLLGTDPNDPDCDDDGLPDGVEYYVHHTDPLDSDTDDDGYSDCDEVARGSDPLNARSIPMEPHVVINEVFYNPTNDDLGCYQFVELYNPCQIDVQIGGYRVRARQFGSARASCQIPDDTIMPPTSYYLIGGPFVCSVDGRVPDLLVNEVPLRYSVESADSSVTVSLDNNGDEVIDGLIYGTQGPDDMASNYPPAVAFPPHPPVAMGQAIARVPTGWDENDADDWTTQDVPTPRGSGNAPLFDPLDLDRDGLPADEEFVLGTDPENADTDADGLGDGEEVAMGLNPAERDSDGDGLDDNGEIGIGANPADRDTDDDGLLDGTETSMGLSAVSADSDGDGVHDGDEDEDSDGFTNAEEATLGSNPESGADTPLSFDGQVPIVHAVEYIDLMNGHRFVQDFMCEVFHRFWTPLEPVPVFFDIYEKPRGHHDYSVSGATLYESEGRWRRYTLLAPLGSKTVTIAERLVNTSTNQTPKYKWPAIAMGGPWYFDLSIAFVAPSEESNVGAFIGVNDDDDDGDGRCDLSDTHIPRGDNDLVQLKLTHPPKRAVTLSWDNSIIKLYEHRSKKLRDRRGLGWIWSARAGACIPNHPYKGFDDGDLYIEGVHPGVTYITATCAGYTERMKVSVVKAGLATDYDHNRTIDAADEQRAKTNEVFRFWVNDDDDQSADAGNDVPGSGPDCANSVVDSMRDLVDFFPVSVDLGETLQNVDCSRLTFNLDHPHGLLNAVWTDLAPANAGNYLVDASDAEGLANETVQALTGFGDTDLPSGFLQRIRDQGKAILLLEGRDQTAEALTLTVRGPWGNPVYERKLPLSISGVERMYRWINLRPSGGPATSTNEPLNNPDSLHNGKNLFFLHGFNVDANACRGWNAEMFKRLFWSGSRAKFWGMTWDGDVGLFNGLHYQEDVANALAVASNFNAQVSGVGGDKIVLAHSLGNMVVSGAIQDHGLNVSKYFMLNAAVATECYRPASFNDTAAGNYMLNADWVEYNSSTWCSTWFRLFSSPDDRAKLTWKARFPSVVSVAYNFYSSGDEIFQVFSNGTPSAFTGGPFHLEQFAWQKQEHFKGRTVLGIPVIGGTDWAGWGFSGAYTVAEANTATTNDLQTNPVFRHEPATILSSNITARVVNDIIAQGVPALSCAAGVDAVNLINFYNYNVNDHRQNGWGRSGPPYYDRWLHSDLKNMAYLHTYEFFDELVSQGGLQ